jgi:hypothetical protein
MELTMRSIVSFILLTFHYLSHPYIDKIYFMYTFFLSFWRAGCYLFSSTPPVSTLYGECSWFKCLVGEEPGIVRSKEEGFGWS